MEPELLDLLVKLVEEGVLKPVDLPKVLNIFRVIEIEKSIQEPIIYELTEDLPVMNAFYAFSPENQE